MTSSLDTFRQVLTARLSIGPAGQYFISVITDMYQGKRDSADQISLLWNVGDVLKLGGFHRSSVVIHEMLQHFINCIVNGTMDEFKIEDDALVHPIVSELMDEEIFHVMLTAIEIFLELKFHDKPDLDEKLEAEYIKQAKEYRVGLKAGHTSTSLH